MKIGDKVFIKESHSGMDFGFVDHEIITVTERNMSFLECSIRGGLAEILGGGFSGVEPRKPEANVDLPEGKTDEQQPVILSNTSSKRRNSKSTDKPKE